VLVAAGAHFAHDMYPSFIGPLVPLVREKLGISLALASLMVPAQQMPSILQPFIGFLADRTSRRWFVVLSPATAAVSLSSLGLAPHFAVVILLLLVSGLSSATFHAPVVALVGDYGGKKMGRAMSIFMAGGELSRTIGPLVITGAVALFTLEGSFVVMVFGLAASVILYFNLDTAASDVRRRAAPQVDLRPLLRARRRPLVGILGFSILTGIATTPFHFFLVEFLVKGKDHGQWYGGFALSTLFASGIVGGLVGGNLSDRLGRRTLLALGTAAAPPLLYLYLWLENGSWPVLGVLALAGAVTMSPRSVVLAVAAELLPEARGPMAGMMLALGFVSMSIAALIFGAFADTIGIASAYWYVPAIFLLGLPFVALLPRPGEPLARPAESTARV
jgi:FSR family fosmidomycin resistance protein-like MFS transporter